MSNPYQKNRRRAESAPLPGGVAVPEQALVSIAKIARGGEGGPAGLAVGTGLQVMTAMSTVAHPQPSRSR